MKVYLYYSKNKIEKFNNPEGLRQGIAMAVTKSFDLFYAFRPEDVVINCVRISNEIDVFLVLDTNNDEDAVRTVNSASLLKSKLTELIHSDQNNFYMDYKIRMKIDPKHVPILTSDSDYCVEKVVKNIPNSSGEDSEID